jgi:hypothetical protein
VFACISLTPAARSVGNANRAPRESSTMWQYYKDTVAWLFKLDSQEWFLAMCAALIIGFFALRGFGSRSNY